MNKYSNLLLVGMLGICFLSGCLSDDLAFDVIESPVLAVFEDGVPSDPNMLALKATFYDLDKSGILDQNIGIDSIPIGGLEVSVYVLESTLIQSFTTNEKGEIDFEVDYADLGSVSTLEWVGVFDETPFRIYKNF